MALKESTKKEQANSYELVVEVDGETFEKAVNAVYKKQVKNINIQGFRKGKAPRKIVEKMYGSEVFYEDAMQDCYPQALYDASQEAGIEIVKVESLEAVEAGKEGFTFKAEVIVKPTMQIDGYKGLEVTRKSTEVTDELIEEEVNKVRERNSRLVAVTDRPAKNGDTVVIDFEGFTDGEAFEGGKAENHTLKLGSGSFIPGFEEQLEGHNVDESFSINVKFPDDYQSEELKGKDAEFKILIHEIKETELPEVDDEFAQDVSDADTVDEWKKQLGETISKRLESEADNDVENQISEKLLELLEGEIPQAMYDNRVNEMIRDFDLQLRSKYGMELSTYMQYMGMDEESLKDMYKEQAEKTVRLRLALETIAEKEAIEVSDEELEEEYKKLAESYKTDVENVKSSIPADTLKEDKRVEKALDLVKNSAVVK